MRVELTEPESVAEPRLWVEHQQVLALVLRPGSVEWGLRRSEMQRETAAGNRTTRFVAHIVVNGHLAVAAEHNPRGGRAAATLASSCRRHEMDPQLYFM